MKNKTVIFNFIQQLLPIKDSTAFILSQQQTRFLQIEYYSYSYCASTVSSTEKSLFIQVASHRFLSVIHQTLYVAICSPSLGKQTALTSAQTHANVRA